MALIGATGNANVIGASMMPHRKFMTDKRINTLNQRLGLALGFRGEHPRFAWVHAKDLFYFLRRGDRHERFCWVDRLGKVWLLAQWRPAPMSEAEWIAAFGDLYLYPGRGYYYAHPETSLKPGLQPDENDTAQVIRRLGEQMEATFASHLKQTNDDIAAIDAGVKNEFYEQVDDFWPSFGNWNSGKRGGHVSFGGI